MHCVPCHGHWGVIRALQLVMASSTSGGHQPPLFAHIEKGKSECSTRACGGRVGVGLYDRNKGEKGREELAQITPATVTVCPGLLLGWIHIVRAVSHRAKVHAKRQKPGLLNKDGRFLGMGPESSFKLVYSLSPGDTGLWQCQTSFMSMCSDCTPR